jgi:mannosyltransferase
MCPTAMGRPRDIARHAPRLLLLAIVALGAFLRFYHIGNKSLWIDEAFSLWMGRQPVGQMLDWLVRIDQHPPLYYLLLHLWMRLGDGEAIVRIPSALCSTLTIPVIYLLGCRLSGQRLGLLAALILAVSPFHVHFAQEARMYALFTLNASLAMLALARLLADPCAATRALGQQFISFVRAWRTDRHRPPLRAIETDLAWLTYILLTAATLWIHNTAVLFPLATNVFVFGQLIYRRFLSHSQTPTLSLRNWLLAQAAAFLLWSPWLPAFITQSAGVYREFWLPPLSWMTFGEVLLGFVSEFLPLPIPALGVIICLHLALAVLGLIALRRWRTWAAFPLAFFAAPFVGEVLVSLRRPILYGRTLIWISLPFYLLLAAGVWYFEPQRRKGGHWPPGRQGFLSSRLCGRELGGWRSLYAVAVVLAMLGLNGLSLHAYYTDFQKEEWDDAAALVAERVDPGDLILFNATWMQIPFDYYFHRLSDAPVVEHGAPVDLFDRGVLEPKMAESDLPRLRSLIDGHGRVWLVYSHNWYTDPDGLIPLALEEKLDLQARWELDEVQVWLYAAP